MANYDVGDALSRIENILLDSIGRNMKRHLKEEADLQKAWSMWQTEQLAGLGNWSAKNYKQFAPQFTKINNSALNMLQQANQNGELNQEIKILQTGIQNAQRFFDVPNDKLDSLLKSVRSDLSRAEHSILRKADDVYREALFDSHFYLQSGTGTLNSAIDMAVSDMHQRGLNSVTYRNGAHVSASVYARMALRTANERAQLLGEGKARDKFGIHTVIVPPSGIACPKCAPWLCRVLVDDVYSAGTPQEAEELKLPLLSEAIRQGFLHPQCNCSPQTYFPDSPVPEMSESQRSESVRKYRITQKQRYHERQIRKWKQAEKSAPDEASKKSAAARKREWQKRNKDLCDANHDFLRRDYFREKIYDYQTPPIVPNVIDKPTPPEPTPRITEAKPVVTTPETVQENMAVSKMETTTQNIISEISLKAVNPSAPEYLDTAEPIRHTKEERQELVKYAKDKGIRLFGISRFDGESELLKEQIDSISEIRQEFNLNRKLTVSFRQMSGGDLGETRPGGEVIYLNKKAFRNRIITDTYLNSDTVLSSAAVKGIGIHEMGHVISAYYGEKGLDIARKTYYNIYKKEISYPELLDFLEIHISEYSTFLPEIWMNKTLKSRYYKEITPEILAKHKTNPDEFTTEFIRLLKEVYHL